MRLGCFLQNRSESIVRYWLHLLPSLFEWLEVSFGSLHSPNFITRRENLEWENRVVALCHSPWRPIASCHKPIEAVEDGVS